MLFQLPEINNRKPTEIKRWKTVAKQYGLDRVTREKDDER